MFGKRSLNFIWAWGFILRVLSQIGCTNSLRKRSALFFRKLSILIIVGAILPLTACGLQTKWVEYHSDTYQLTLSHPEDWSVEEDEEEGSLHVTNPLGWGIHIYTDTSEYIAEDPKELLEEILSQVSFESKISEDPIQTFTLNGYGAASKRFLLEDEIRIPPEMQGFLTPIATPPVEWIITILQEDDRQVIIISSQIDGRWRDLDYQIKAILRSFRFQE